MLSVSPFMPQLHNHTKDFSLPTDDLSSFQAVLTTHRFLLEFFYLLVFSAGFNLILDNLGSTALCLKFLLQ